MPNRYLKESICTSKNLNKLSSEAENLFYRLLISVDDFGRYHGDPSIILGHCYPLKLDTIKPLDIGNRLKELEGQNLIKLYQVEDMTYLEIVKWLDHNKPRADVSKYPAIDSSCKQVRADVSNGAQIPPYSYSYSYSNNTKRNKDNGNNKDDPDKFVKGKYGHMVER